MKAFTIDAENNITVHGSRKAAARCADRLSEAIFASEEELAALVGASGKRLVEIWNGLTGVAPVTKFTSSAVAIKRICKAIQTLEPAAAPDPEAEEAAPKAKSPTKHIDLLVRQRDAKATAGTGAPRGGSKVARVIAMLKGDGGATLEQINTAMGWQAHTTRALMSAGGSIYKKFGMTVVSEIVDGDRTYRI